ncbi:ASPM [Branchiostoma lanceolatum]|uniref:ASPM protein n=2 Tax=Branchiostoma lanceolatum TaxID=7740 RepID=A0A8K0EYB9_BRALA|nr:ASPM [Branchiostoma lanceolatum]
MDGSGDCKSDVPPGADDVRSMTWFDPWDRKGTLTSPSEETGEDLPVLQLTNFAVTPRVGFGVVRVGETQTRKLLLHNPEQFPVTVLVEKVPRAKGYSVDFTEVEVQAAEDTVVSLQWTPGDPCNSRALLGLKLDDAYRLHVILYGRAVAPVCKQKRTRRRTRPRGAVQQGSADAAPDTDGENVPPDQPDVCKSPQVKLSHNMKLTKDSAGTCVEPGNMHQDAQLINNGRTGTTDTGTILHVPNSSSVQKTKRILQQSTVTKRRQNFGKSSEGLRIKVAKKELFGPPAPSDQLQQQAVSQHSTNVQSCSSAGNHVKSQRNVQSQAQETSLVPGKPLVLRSAVSNNKETAANSLPQKVLVKRGVAQTKIKSQAVKVKSTQDRNQDGTAGGTSGCQPKVAKSKLCLVKTSKRHQSVQAHHYMPYVSKNMYYDERWMQKQERAFIQWLNFILIPNAMESQPGRNVTGSVPAVMMREYAVLCNLNQVRRAACLLFQSEPMARVIHRVEEEVDTGRLQVRKDKHLHADQGIRRHILDMLLSYSPLWLRVGLETIFGEVLPLQHNEDVSGLSRFVLNRVLGNSDIAQQFSHPTVPHMYKTGYAEALAKFTLKKFLTLVFFMDRAKLTRLIDQDPCLFCSNANIKSSKELLLTFSREYLSGEGDVTRHLSFLGFAVTHQQTALMEMDYTVHNLATDLRDGLRLNRAVELLTRNWTLSSKLRVPVVSRLQKIHNSKVALDALLQVGVSLDTGLRGGKIEARDIVDGRQEKTLALLWKLIFHFQVCVEVEQLQLQKEVTLLRRELRLRRGTDMWLEMYGPDSGNTTDHTRLLLQLCQAVCAFYNIRVDNFSVSFSDGRVLCLLVHHYLPELLPLEQIYMDTTQSYNTNHSGQAGITTQECPETDKDKLKELLAHEKNNFRLVNQKVVELGTIPPLLCVTDMSNTIPDEKVVMTTVSYLCARVINLSLKVRAVRTIQAAWRRYHPKPAVKKWTENVQRATIRLQAAVRGMLLRRSLQTQHKSATTIQTAVKGWVGKRQYKKQRQAAIILQQHVRAHLARKNAQKKYQDIRRATIRLQAAVRGMHVRRQQKQTQLAATSIQACWRGHQQLVKYKAVKLATTIIQQRFKAFKLMQEKQHQYKSLRSATICLQVAVRGILLRRSLQRQHKSATTIQTAVRGWTARQQYLKQRQSAITLQQHVRAHLARKNAEMKYQHVRGAVICLQAGIRGFLVRQQLMKWVSASTIIQASFRCFLQRRRYLSTRAAVCRLQAGVRGWKARRTYQQVKSQHRAALVIQSTYRGFATRRFLQHWQAERQRRLLHFSAAVYHHLAATRLQRSYRRYLVWQKAKQQLKALITIQASVRAWLQRKHFVLLQRAVCKLQAAVRSHQKQRLTATVVLQSYVRMYLAKKLMIQRKKAVIVLQATWRGHHTRKNIKNKRIRIAYKKIMAAKRAATEDKKLCNMTATALNLLLKYKHLSTILDALRSMEVVTRLSAVCCDQLVQGGAVQVIYTLIQSCNRSLPCQEIIKYSISILLNLAKNPNTVAAAVVQEGGVETLVNLMAIYREKDDVIFGQTCLLLTLFCNNAAYQKEVLNMPSVTQKLQSLHRLVKRKAWMSRSKQRIGSQEDRRKTSTPLVQMVHHIKPAWILRKDNMLDVPEPLQSIQLVLVTLGLQGAMV